MVNGAGPIVRFGGAVFVIAVLALVGSGPALGASSPTAGIPTTHRTLPALTTLALMWGPIPAPTAGTSSPATAYPTEHPAAPIGAAPWSPHQTASTAPSIAAAGSIGTGGMMTHCSKMPRVMDLRSSG